MKRKIILIEILIFSSVLIFSINSARSLLLTKPSPQDLQDTADILAFKLKRISRSGTTRSIASTTPNKDVTLDDLNSLSNNGYEPYKIRCAEEHETIETSSPRIRLIGINCHPEGEDENETLASAYELKNTSAINKSVDYEATVFQDKINHTFSTDFIPLSYGKNEIIIGFHYSEEKTVPIYLSVFRKKN